MAVYNCRAVLGGCGGAGKVSDPNEFCSICSKIINGESKMEAWRPCPGVLGGCGGTGKIRGNEVLCTTCIASQED